jgi:hypothetical protein
MVKRGGRPLLPNGNSCDAPLGATLQCHGPLHAAMLAFHLLPDVSKHGGPRSRDCRSWSNAVADHFCPTAIFAMVHLAPPYNAMGLFTLQCSRSICCRMCRNTVGRVRVIADHGQTRWQTTSAQRQFLRWSTWRHPTMPWASSRCNARVPFVAGCIETRWAAFP